jgi:ABC-type methionine transport system ATPase subunit
MPNDGTRRRADQVLVLWRRLQREFGMDRIFVTHDFGVAAEIANTVAVMHAARVVESGPVGPCACPSATLSADDPSAAERRIQTLPPSPRNGEIRP